MSVLDLSTLGALFEKGLEQHLRYSTAPIEMLEPMIYSLRNGGKRVRPIMLLWVLAIQSVDCIKLGINTAIALEMIHTYSLIHDDLPAMDNDDLRRGMPTNHKQFGEATAILAGDALLTDAFSYITSDDFLPDTKKVQLIDLLSKAAGSTGMVAGQLSDIQGQGQPITVEQLARIHYLKTGKLFLFAVQAASVIADLAESEQVLLEQFATYFGRAFQIHNDLMDVISTTQERGKETQADAALDKATYPSLLTLEGAKKALQAELDSAMNVLRQLSEQTQRDYQSLSVFLKYVTLES